MKPAGAPDVRDFLAGPAPGHMEAGRIAATRILSAEEIEDLDGAGGAAMVLEHERIPFVSFPYEWPPEMLHAAGALTLELAQSLLPEGFGLKDATPYNVLFRGPKPVFVDLLSFERRRPDDPIWLPYAQFARTFLLPLLANRRLGMELQPMLTTRRDGLEPEEVYRRAAPLQRLSPRFLPLVTIPAWLGRRQAVSGGGVYQHRATGNAEKARFIMASLLGRLQRRLRSLEPKGRRGSMWAGYTAEREATDDFRAKSALVWRYLAECRPRVVLDIGCNTGHFSELAARRGARVTAIDRDPAAVGETWRRAVHEKLDILPLVVNLASPSPGLGWCNREFPSFLERARGAFDTVLMLAVVHHLLVGEGVPLEEIARLAADLAKRWALVEYVGPEDAMFRRLARGRDELYRWLNREAFEAAWGRWFEMVRAAEIGGRWIYLMRRRD